MSLAAISPPVGPLYCFWHCKTQMPLWYIPRDVSFSIDYPWKEPLISKVWDPTCGGIWCYHPLLHPALGHFMFLYPTHTYICISDLFFQFQPFQFIISILIFCNPCSPIDAILTSVFGTTIGGQSCDPIKLVPLRIFFMFLLVVIYDNVCPPY